MVWEKTTKLNNSLIGIIIYEVILRQLLTVWTNAISTFLLALLFVNVL